MLLSIGVFPIIATKSVYGYLFYIVILHHTIILVTMKVDLGVQRK